MASAGNALTRTVDESYEMRAVHHASRCYAILGRHLPPSTTLGELIVLSEVAKGVDAGKPVTVSEIVEATGLSRWSVGRIVMRYIDSGAIREEKDSSDSCKNLWVWTPESFSLSRNWSRDWSSVMGAIGDD